MADLYQEWIEKVEGRKGQFIKKDDRTIFIGGPGGGSGTGGSGEAASRGVSGLVGLEGQTLVNYMKTTPDGRKAGWGARKLPRGLIVESGDTTLTVDRSNGAVLSGMRYGEFIDLRNQSARVVGENSDYFVQGSF